MPGILYHSAFAWSVYQKCKNVISIDKMKFLEGNLIPDLSLESKEKTHFQVKSSVDGFYVPDLKQVQVKLFPQTINVVLKDNFNSEQSNLYYSLILGMYCHLYLDYFFITGYLIPEFIWEEEKDIVINPRNNKVWTVNDFFSSKGMYGSYTEINQLMLRDNHIPLEIIEEIPEILPNTGITIYDNRREKTWKKELQEYMDEKKEYTGDVLDYDRLWNCIENIAIQFVNELKTIM